LETKKFPTLPLYWFTKKGGGERKEKKRKKTSESFQVQKDCSCHGVEAMDVMSHPFKLSNLNLGI